MLKNKIFPYINGGYLKDEDLYAMSLDPVHTSTRILLYTLFKHTSGRRVLSEKDKRILLKDIQKLKDLFMWDYSVEEKTLEEFNKAIEEKQLLDQLSEYDQRRYMERKIEKVLKDIPF